KCCASRLTCAAYCQWPWCRRGNARPAPYVTRTRQEALPCRQADTSGVPIRACARMATISVPEVFPTLPAALIGDRAHFLEATGFQTTRGGGRHGRRRIHGLQTNAGALGLEQV